MMKIASMVTVSATAKPKEQKPDNCKQQIDFGPLLLTEHNKINHLNWELATSIQL